MSMWSERIGPSLVKHKYVVLLFAILQHLYVGIVLANYHQFYMKYIWVANMVILGLASTGVFSDQSRTRTVIRNLLILLVIGIPLALGFASDIDEFMIGASILYAIYFAFIFAEILRFLLRPSHIDVNHISAAACGYFLLVEIGVFALQGMHYFNYASFANVSGADVAATYMDMVYFVSITISTIGFGDITPVTHDAKLATALLGTFGQLYTVVLIGILVGKYTANTGNNSSS